MNVRHITTQDHVRVSNVPLRSRTLRLALARASGGTGHDADAVIYLVFCVNGLEQARPMFDRNNSEQQESWRDSRGGGEK